MEDTLWVGVTIWVRKRRLRLNPYSNGRYSMRWAGGYLRGHCVVLILILMEYDLRDAKDIAAACKAGES